MKSLKALGLTFAASMLLVSCGNTQTSSNKYPTNDQEVVDKVATVGAIATTVKNVNLNQGANTTLNDGVGIILATKWTVQAWDGSAPVNVSVNIEWSFDSDAGWSKKDKTPDNNHVTYIPTMPKYGQEASHFNLTGVIKYWDATKTVEYALTVNPSTTAPTEYTNLGDFFKDGKIDANKLNKPVVVYGYVLGAPVDGYNAYIGSGAYGCQLYKTQAYKDLYTPGTLLKCTGTMTNYSGLELTDCLIETCDRTDIAAVDWVNLDDTVYAALAKNGTVYDNAPGTVKNAEFVSFTASDTTKDMTASFKTSTGKEFALFVKKGATDDTKNAVVNALKDAAAGAKFNLKGVLCSYKGAVQIYGYTADCITLAAD